jgi:hypothetical protein
VSAVDARRVVSAASVRRGHVRPPQLISRGGAARHWRCGLRCRHSARCAPVACWFGWLVGGDGAGCERTSARTRYVCVAFSYWPHACDVRA